MKNVEPIFHKRALMRLLSWRDCYTEHSIKLGLFSTSYTVILGELIQINCIDSKLFGKSIYSWYQSHLSSALSGIFFTQIFINDTFYESFAYTCGLLIMPNMFMWHQRGGEKWSNYIYQIRLKFIVPLKVLLFIALKNIPWF